MALPSAFPPHPHAQHCLGNITNLPCGVVSAASDTCAVPQGSSPSHSVTRAGSHQGPHQGLGFPDVDSFWLFWSRPGFTCLMRPLAKVHTCLQCVSPLQATVQDLLWMNNPMQAPTLFLCSPSIPRLGWGEF